LSRLSFAIIFHAFSSNRYSTFATRDLCYLITDR